MRTSPALVDALLDPEYSEIGASGRLWTRAEIIDALAGERRSDPILDEQMTARVLTAELVLLTYVSDAGGRRARRSSLWRRSGGRWRVLHHQGTLLTGSGEVAPVTFTPERE